MRLFPSHIGTLVIVITVGAALYFLPVNRESDESGAPVDDLKRELKMFNTQQSKMEKEVEHLTDIVSTLAREISDLRSEVHQSRVLEPPAGFMKQQTMPTLPKGAKTIVLQKPVAPSNINRSESTTDSGRELASRERMERHDELLETEAIDPEWAPATRLRIIEAFDQMDLSASELNGIECRSNRCRVSVLHENEGAKGDFLRTFPVRISSVLPRAVLSHFKLEGDRVESVLHLSKKKFVD